MMQVSEKPSLVIWGAAGHALVVADIVRLQDKYEIVGFLDDVNPGREGAIFCGSQILGGKEQLDRLQAQGVRHILLGFGNCKMRLELTKWLQSKNFLLPSAVHPQAIVAQDAVIGAGTVISAGAVVNPAVKIGKSVIINTAATVDHECTIGDAAHIGPGAHLAGHVTVGQATQIGIGAAVIDRIHVGAQAIVGAGAVVVEDIPERVVAYGVPAQIKRSIDRG